MFFFPSFFNSNPHPAKLASKSNLKGNNLPSSKVAIRSLANNKADIPNARYEQPVAMSATFTGNHFVFSFFMALFPTVVRRSGFTAAADGWHFNIRFRNDKLTTAKLFFLPLQIPYGIVQYLVIYGGHYAGNFIQRSTS